MEPRVRTIRAKLTASNSSSGTIIYTPAKFNINGTQIKSNGYINTLRCNCYIESLPETSLPPLDPAADAYEIDQRNKQLQMGNRKTLQVSIKDANSNEFEFFQFDVFATRPRYFADLAPFLSDLEIYGVEFGISFYIKAVDLGYGVLSGNDFIVIQGSVLETCSFLLTDQTITVNPSVIDLLSIPS